MNIRNYLIHTKGCEAVMVNEVMMDNKDSRYNNNKVLELFFENQGYKNLRTYIDKLFKYSIWWYTDKKISENSIRPLLLTQRARNIDDYISLSDYKPSILSGIYQAKRKKGAQIFKHNTDNTYGIAIPLYIEDKLYGVFGIVSIKAKPAPFASDLITGYTKIILDIITKEFELSRVYEIIRPRTIALSSVHTINRLITSTLDIKELFPRIARLCLQVLRAERASICLINKETEKLDVIATINYKRSKDIFKVKRRPTPIEIKVVKTGRCIRRNNILAVPLCDEDVCGAITVREKVKKERFTIFDQEILTTLAEQSVIAIRNAQIYKEQEDLTIGTIKSLSHLLDSKFPRAYTHTDFFVELILELGKEVGMNRKQLKILHYSALLPDLGKVVVPEEILQKEKELSGKEKNIIKTHTIRGIETLQYMDVLKPVIPIILHHHERYDGTGYPQKLKGKDIPLGSRIMAVADALEAMLCHRPYRTQMPFRMAISEIRRQSLKQFDPDIIDAFIRIAKSGKLESLICKHRDEFKKCP